MNYHEEVLRTLAGHVPEDEYLTLAAIGLCGEAGEVADMVKKHLFQGATLDKEALLKELGDVRWYLEVFCHVLNTNMKDIEAMNVAKLRQRYPNGFQSKK